MNKQSKFVFYLETFILTVSFILVIVVLSRVFVVSATQSVKAKHLTNVVCLSENVAEVMMSADDRNERYDLLNENSNAEDSGIITVRYDDDLKPAKDGIYVLTVSWEEEASANGSFVNSTIKAYVRNETEPVFELQTGKYLSEVLQ